jgi:iron uptake system EfeUOB component EfeO/EfeM
MAVSPLGISDSDGGHPNPRPWRRHARLLVGVAVLAVIALIAAALIPGGGGNSGTPTKPFGVATTAHGAPAKAGPARITTVFGSTIPAKDYGTKIAQQEQGIDANGQLASDLSPVAPSAFAGPVAAYRHYAEHWAAKLAADLPALRAALAGGGRSASERAWGVAYSDYLHLGAVYGLLPGTIDQRIDGMPNTLPGNGSSGDPGASFSGLHRIEYGLWTGASPRSLGRWASQLQRDVVSLRRALPTVEISPLDYATRAHEILEDAQRDLLSGTDVPWSGDGVLGTAAGLAATQEVIGTLTPLLQGRDNTLGEVQSWLPQLQAVLNRLRAAHHGTYPSLGQLSTAQREQLNGAMTGTLGALADVPGTLETADLPVIPKIPGSR